jgi:hypothetical protein
MHESGIGPYGLRNRPSEKRKTVCAPLTRDRLTIRSGLGCSRMSRAAPKARQSSASSVVLSHPGPHQGHDPSPDGIGEAVPAGGQLRRDRFGYHQPPQRLREVGGPSAGLLGPLPVGACHGRARSRFQIRKKIRSRSLIPVRPRWGPSGGGRHRRRHRATG